ncbi:hypothetical protein HK099_001582 [Clydaea vesicula]|uniref:Uncharacterized protein n=1 Tax=Clydaea vesicula TaxID=447962 RepID=A0AAD5XX57_9FUNG|nr:hypothetical protein HK099_001582 [Clydaea vesicula]
MANSSSKIIYLNLFSYTVHKAAVENEKNNFRFPVNAIEITGGTSAAVNSKACLERGRCDPVGGWFQEVGCSDPCFYDTEFSKINFKKIDGVIDLSNVLSAFSVNDEQFSSSNQQNSTFFLHTDDINISGNKNLVSLFEKLLFTFSNDEGENFEGNFSRTFAEGEENIGLPPTSLNSYLNIEKSLPGIAIGDFKNTLTNKYYF